MHRRLPLRASRSVRHIVPRVMPKPLPTAPVTGPCYLGALPQEMLLYLAKFLTYASTFALRYSCRTFYNIIKPSENLTMADLLDIEKWPWYSAGNYRFRHTLATLDFFACSLCLRLRSPKEFSNAMMRGAKGKNSPNSSVSAIERFCIPCGIKTNKYPRGTKMHYGGPSVCGGHGYGVVCRECGQLKPEVNEWRCQTCQNEQDRKNFAAQRRLKEAQRRFPWWR